MRFELNCAVFLVALVTLTACQHPPPPPMPQNLTADERKHTCAPWYPAKLREAGVEGTTALTFTVTVEGTVTDESVYQSSGNRTLDLAALHCVHYWRYFPAKLGGQPVAASIMAKIVWQLIPEAIEEAAPAK
jgi:TonB family protein